MNTQLPTYYELYRTTWNGPDIILARFPTSEEAELASHSLKEYSRVRKVEGFIYSSYDAWLADQPDLTKDIANRNIAERRKEIEHERLCIQNDRRVTGAARGNLN
jgi:hypothetical protein